MGSAYNNLACKLERRKLSSRCRK